MATEPSSDVPQSLIAETQELWDAKAAFWDERMGEGNAFQRLLVGPAAERLLMIQPGETVLDVACGNGVFARRLAELGAQVIATDFSAKFLELAQARTNEYAGRIEYQQVDATDEDQLLALGEGRFDAAVCNMALMDMPTIAPLLRALRHLLTSTGRFVFTVQHPAFNSNVIRMGIEEDERLETTRYIKVTGYLNVAPGLGAGMPGEPTPHWYFHRPLQELLNTCFAAGLVVNGLEEPAFASEDGGGGALSWLAFSQIPPVLAVRVVQAR